MQERLKADAGVKDKMMEGLKHRAGEDAVVKENPWEHVPFSPGPVEREVLCGAVRALLLKQGRWQPVVHMLEQQLDRCVAAVNAHTVLEL
jgi:hypothetical protein